MKRILPIFFATVASAASVNVTWDVPSDPTVTGYIVRYGPSSTNKVQAINVGNTNLARITGIPDNIQVYMEVVSYNGFGRESLPSNEINFSTLPPQPPKLLRITNSAVVVTVSIQPGQ